MRVWLLRGVDRLLNLLFQVLPGSDFWFYKKKQKHHNKIKNLPQLNSTATFPPFFLSYYLTRYQNGKQGAKQWWGERKQGGEEEDGEWIPQICQHICLLFGNWRQKITVWNLFEYLQAQVQCPKHRNAAVSFLPLVPGLLMGIRWNSTTGLLFLPVFLFICVSGFELAEKQFRETILGLLDFRIS